MAGEAIFNLEAQADEEIGKMPMWNYPLRSVLTALFLFADHAESGGRFRIRRGIEAGIFQAIHGRIAYLAKFFERCTLKLGSDVDNAISPFGSDIKPIFDALVYAHFCELMPEIRAVAVQAGSHAS